MYRCKYERITQKKLLYQTARQAGISRHVLGGIEHGRIVPTPDELGRLARVLDVPASELMKRVVLPDAEPTTTEAVTR